MATVVEPARSARVDSRRPWRGIEGRASRATTPQSLRRPRLRLRTPIRPRRSTSRLRSFALSRKRGARPKTFLSIAGTSPEDRRCHRDWALASNRFGWAPFYLPSLRGNKGDPRRDARGLFRKGMSFTG
jgi:hypothetical protein